MTKNGEGVVLCATFVERENGWSFKELNVTSTSNFITNWSSCNLRSSLCFLGFERELLFINLFGSTVYRGSSVRLRIIFELTRTGYSCGFGVGGLEVSSGKYSSDCMDELDSIELGE